MINAKLVVIASMLLATLPSPGAAQQATDLSRAWTAASAVESPRRWTEADTASVPPRGPRDRTSRFVIGTVWGAFLGATGGSIYGYRNYEPCQTHCSWDRGHEAFLFAILGGLGGGSLGGLAGWFWPDRPAHSLDVELTPTPRDGVAVSFSVRH